jgi:4-methyl-5(b-hydroxyethyl)-thiazole monophosphate biosynthesis
MDMEQKVIKGKVFVLLAHGFEEIDVAAVTRILRGSGLSVSVVGLTAGPVRGAYGLSLVTDCALSEVDTELAQAAILPGGIQATRRFSAEPRVHTLLRQVAEERGYVMAIDTARAVLRSAGVLGSREPVSGNGAQWGRFERSAAGWRGRDSPLDGLDGLPCERVRVEGRVILSQGSDSAEEAALTLASMLEG